MNAVDILRKPCDRPFRGDHDPFPVILSLSDRLTPEHSGDICPIRGCGGYENTLTCECEDREYWIDEVTHR